jgi:hypothetical protein
MGSERTTGETSSIRTLKSMMDASSDSPRRARRDAESYYEHASTQVVQASVNEPKRLTKLIWRIELWMESRALAKEARQKRKALLRVNTK